jgi:hypothetical protein
LTNVYGFPGMDYLRHNTGKFINNKQHTTNWEVFLKNI